MAWRGLDHRKDSEFQRITDPKADDALYVEVESSTAHLLGPASVRT